MSFSGQTVARGSQDPTVCGRVSAQRNDFRLTSALPEPDSLLTQMALVTEESRDGRRTGCARSGTGQVTCQAKYTRRAFQISGKAFRSVSKAGIGDGTHPSSR